MGKRVYHFLFGASTPQQLVQVLAAILAMLSGWAWAKSAILQLRPDIDLGWMDRLLERISRNPTTWNAIAAFLAAIAAVTESTALLVTLPK
jgi:hypothetical protein